MYFNDGCPICFPLHYLFHRDAMTFLCPFASFGFTFMSLEYPRATPIEIPSAVVRFAGDSGDGMQLAGTQLTDTSAIFGNDIATFPDYPAEIRAPQGTVAGVSGFQVHFSSKAVYTPGDKVGTLVAMNPAAFKAHIGDLEHGGICIVDETEFSKTNLKKAGYKAGYNPLDDEKFTQRFKILRVPITAHNATAGKGLGLNTREVGRCRNMYALGLVYWIYDRPLETTIRHIEETFRVKKNLPLVADANVAAIKAGYHIGETLEAMPSRMSVARATVAPGKYRKVTGNEATAMGLIAASKLAGKELIYCSYPITPASDVLHYLANGKRYGVKTFQAEDEIAACCAAIGASFAGQLGVTGTSGPGMALKMEAISLAVMTELPLVVVDVQRGGPSTGMPTKTEQADLWQAIFGRNSDCPLVVLAPQSPADCFDMAIEASRIALQRRVPVLLLTDGYIANGSEPWKIPAVDSFQSIEIKHPDASCLPLAKEDGEKPAFQTYTRDENLARPWAIPGTVGLEHRLGGLEKSHIHGAVTQDAANHQLMTRMRAEKVARVSNMIPDLEIEGDQGGGELLVLGWGGTYGSIHDAVEVARNKGLKVSQAHLRHMNPMPKNLGEVLKKFRKVLIPELNNGQLRLIIRGKFLVDARGLNKIQGRSLLTEEITQGIDLMLNGQWGEAEALYPIGGNVEPSKQSIEYLLATA